MKRFRFRLEGLLRVRKIAEERRLREFRERLQEYRALLEAIESLDDERRRCMERLRLLEEGELSIENILTQRRYLNALYGRVLEMRSQLAEARRRMVAAQKLLDEAVRERKSVERLRERRRQEYLVELQRTEMRDLDEMARAARHLREEGITP